jgi:two-component system, chemotaxis family, protein-glutamate methylesterase/glutaminase
MLMAAAIRAQPPSRRKAMARSPVSQHNHNRFEAVSHGDLSDTPAQRGAGVIAIGASAGGVEALRAVVAGLPPELPAAVLIVLHIPRAAPSALPGILHRSGPLPAVAARHGMPARPGKIYVAPADHHLLIRDEHLTLSVGPMENGHRPAIDPLFRSVAVAYGVGAIGVVLSGSRDDGAAGLTAIVERGGQAVVQDPEEALHRSMPASALEHVAAAHVLPAAKIGALLGELVGDGALPLEAPYPAPQLAAEDEIAALSSVTTESILSARPSGFSCPSCQGVLFELDGEPAPRYRCRVGHAWSPRSLVAEQTAAVDQALWVALRTLEEDSAMNLRLAEFAERRERPRAAALYRQRYESSKVEAGRLRELISRIRSDLERSADNES